MATPVAQSPKVNVNVPVGAADWIYVMRPWEAVAVTDDGSRGPAAGTSVRMVIEEPSTFADPPVIRVYTSRCVHGGLDHGAPESQ